MAEIPPIKVSLVADVENLKQGLQKAEQQIEALQNSTTRAAGGMDVLDKGMAKLKVAAIAAAVAIGAVATKMAVDAVKGAMEEQAAQERLVVTLGNVIGATREQTMAMDAQLEKMALASGVADDQLRPAFSKLVVATKDAGEAQRLLKIAMDVSAATGKPLEAVTSSLSRAYAGNTAGLARLGVGLGAAEIKALGLKGSVDKLAETFKGAADKQANTLEFRIKRVKLAFEESAETIATALLPIIEKLVNFLNDTVIPAFEKLQELFKKYKSDIKAFAVGVGIATAAWGLYTIAVNASKIATKAMELAQKGLNAAMKANPIGLVIVAAGLLAVAIKRLWDNSETFRRVVISVAKAAINAFASIIPMVAQVFEAIMKVNTGPLRLLLLALSKLPGVGKDAKAGLDAINTGLNSISDMGQKAADKARELSSKLDGMVKITKKAGEEGKKTGKDVKDAFDGIGNSAKKAAANTKKLSDEIAKLKKEGQDIVGDMNKVVAKGEERKAEAAKTRDKAIATAQRRAVEAMEKAEKKAAKDRAKAQQAYDDEVLRAQETRDKAEIAARKRNTETLIKIAQDYAKRVQDITNTKNEAIAKAEEKANDARIKAEEAAANKRLSIIQQSIDRLRSAFAAKTGFDLAESFKSGGSVERLLTDLKDKLAGAQELQANAAALAGRGYSQTFIEEVVKQGPEIGNQLAKSLLEATPQATAELQALYSAVETVSETGLDSLAKQMNTGANLATRELREAYAQVAVDLSESLAEINKNLTDELAEANKAYEASILEAKNLRDAGLADAAKELQEALDEAANAYAENVKDAQRTLTRALAEINAELAETLEEINKELSDAIAEANAEYNEAIQEIVDETAKALNELAAQLAEVAASLRKLGNDIAASNLLRSAPSGVDTGLAIRAVPADGSVASWRAGEEKSWSQYVITQNFNNLKTSAYDVNNATVAGIRYGQAVTVGTSIRAMGRD